MIHQDLAHRPRSHPEEMCPVLPARARLINELIEGLLITLRPFGKQQRHFVGAKHGARVENAELLLWPNYTPPSFLRPRFAWCPPAKEATGHDQFRLSFPHEAEACWSREELMG
jgi:hypothetical protein